MVFGCVTRNTIGVWSVLSSIAFFACTGDSQVGSNLVGDSTQIDTLKRTKAKCSITPNPIVSGEAFSLQATELGRSLDVRIDAKAVDQTFSWTTMADRSGRLIASSPQVVTSLGPATFNLMYVQRNNESLLTTCEAEVVAPPDVTPPIVAITGPLSGTTFGIEDTVQITASATDDIGIDAVVFFLDEVPVFTDIEAPFSYDWTFDINDNGAHRLRAEATDTSGNRSSSEVVIVELSIPPPEPVDTIPPSVRLVSPAMDTVYSQAQTVVFLAAAEDDRNVTHVEFFRGSSLVFTDLSAPYEFSWAVDEKDNGTYIYTAIAQDAAGNRQSSEPVSVTVAVENRDTTSPTVTIVNPSSGVTYAESGSVTVEASATDNVGVRSVAFYLDGVLLHTDASAPHEYAWNFNAGDNGAHTWTAVAQDAEGNRSTSEPVSTWVDINTHPNDILVTSFGRLGPISSIKAKGRMAEYEDVTALIYVESTTTKKWLYMKDGQGHESRIYLPGLDDDMIFNAQYILASRNTLWVFSSNGGFFSSIDGAPAVARRYQLSGDPFPTTAALASEKFFGDDRSVASSMIKLKSGGLVATWYRHHEYNGTLDDRFAELFIVYRSPQGNWQELSPIQIDYLPNSLHRLTLAQHPTDDSIWCFSKADSFSTIWALHLTETSDGLQLDWIDSQFISQDTDGDLGPEGEAPALVAVPDPHRNTLLLAYQNEYDQIFSTSPFIKGAYVSIVEIDLDRSKRFIVFEQYTERVKGLNGLIVLPDEIQILFKPVDTINLVYGDVYLSRYRGGIWSTPEFVGSPRWSTGTVAYGGSRSEVGLNLKDGSIHFYNF